jgi:hypothetical protein
MLLAARFLFTRFPAGLQLILCFALLGGAVALTANEPFLIKPVAEWTETQALQVLNDSPWAHPTSSVAVWLIGHRLLGLVLAEGCVSFIFRARR